MLPTFSERFKSVNAPQAPFQDEQHLEFSQSLLSNLMEGLGYFHGTSKVDASSALEYAETGKDFWVKASSVRSNAAVEEQSPLSAFQYGTFQAIVPSRILLDEDFHLQVILDWDMDLALEIVLSWLDLMDENGWIAREQILGPEARSKVPADFQTQYQHYTNPPTLFSVIQEFVARLSRKPSYPRAPSQYLSDPEAGEIFLTGDFPKVEETLRVVSSNIGWQHDKVSSSRS